VRELPPFWIGMQVVLVACLLAAVVIALIRLF